MLAWVCNSCCSCQLLLSSNHRSSSTWWNSSDCNTYVKELLQYFRGGSIHMRQNCPAWNSRCNSWEKKRPLCLSLCVKSRKSPCKYHSFNFPTCTLFNYSSTCPESPMEAPVKVTVYGNVLMELIGSGSSDSFISGKVAKYLSFKVHSSFQDIIIYGPSISQDLYYWLLLCRRQP